MHLCGIGTARLSGSFAQNLTCLPHQRMALYPNPVCVVIPRTALP